MRIKSIHVKNYRSIYDEKLHVDKLTILAGANGTGKSSFLHALELFAADEQKITPLDFYNNDKEQEIVFSVKFTDLSKDIKSKFLKYIIDDEFTVERVFKVNGEDINCLYHGIYLGIEDFKQYKKTQNATDGCEEYNKLRNQKYTALPQCKNREERQHAIEQFEKDHQKDCTEMRDGGKIFSFTKKDTMDLSEHIKFLYIPAVNDTSLDAVDKKNSVFGELINLTIRDELLEGEKFKEFKNKYRDEYKEILSENKPKMTKLSANLTNKLQKYALDAKVKLEWQELDTQQINTPFANVNLVEDGYEAHISRTGDGLQRLFMITQLEYLAKIISNQTVSAESTMYVLIIEEPELYQHPIRQRHLFDIFNQLIKKNIQIVCSTHSPHFLNLEKIDQIRLLKKSDDRQPKITKIFSVTINIIRSEMNKAYTTKSDDQLRMRLSALNTSHIIEGFFSRSIILVEGITDVATIIAASVICEISLNEKGISIINANGVDELHKLLIIFKQFKIPTYPIWDNDIKNNGDTGTAKRNKNILKLCDELAEEYPNGVKNNCACFENNLENIMKKHFGSDYDEKIKTYAKEYNIRQEDACKKPIIIQKVLEDLTKGKKIPDIFKNIFDKLAN